MNKILHLVRAARASAPQAPLLSSDVMLTELLALHEDMIAQLCLEQHETAGDTGLITVMIVQHRKTAAAIRATLESHRAAVDDSSVIIITGEASSAAAKSLVTAATQGTRGPKSVRNDMTIKS